MTSLIAILALAPLALGIGTGAAMQQPLAIAIIAGLIAAVPIVLILMPAVYLLLVRLPREAEA
jgi:multidrug efflux pump subunit AcrB